MLQYMQLGVLWSSSRYTVVRSSTGQRHQITERCKRNKNYLLTGRWASMGGLKKTFAVIIIFAAGGEGAWIAMTFVWDAMRSQLD